MPLKQFRPITPTQRYLILNVDPELSKKKPEARLTESTRKSGGRNCYGRITSRRRGGGHRRRYRIVDFRRDKIDIPSAAMLNTDLVKLFTAIPERPQRKGRKLFARDTVWRRELRRRIGNEPPDQLWGDGWPARAAH